MTDAEKYADREKEIDEKSAAFRQSRWKKDYKAVSDLGGELQTLYKEQYEGAEASGKNASAVREEALKKIAEVGALMVQAEKDQAAAAEEKRADWADQVAEYAKRVGELEAKLTAITRMQLAPTLAIDTSSIDALIARLNSIPKEIRTKHVIEEVTSAAKRFGGFINRLARGGGLPGWGGGDIVRALLEPGEYVIRKEAVRKYGAGLFDMLNRMKLELPQMIAAGLPAMPRMAYAGGGEVLEVRFSAGGKFYPVRVASRQDLGTVRELAKELNRGEYGPPY